MLGRLPVLISHNQSWQGHTLTVGHATWRPPAPTVPDCQPTSCGGTETSITTDLPQRFDSSPPDCACVLFIPQGDQSGFLVLADEKV